MSTFLQNFRFEIDVDCFEKADAGDQERRIGGVCSTNDVDRQNEVILQKGLDFTPFLNDGWFNDNHQPGMDAVLGYPSLAELRKSQGHEAWYVEGYMLKGVPRADGVWMLAKALKAGGGQRKLGFSVEGGVLERAPGAEHIVRKAIVRHVAITHCPVNTSTSLEILAKSLAAGSDVPMPRNVPAESDQGRILSPQSIEAGIKKKRKKRNLSPLETRILEKADRGEMLTRDEAVLLLKALVPQLRDRDATRIVEHTIRFH